MKVNQLENLVKYHFLPAKQAAKLVKRHEQTIRDWGNKGLVRIFNPYSRVILYNKEDLIKQKKRFKESYGIVEN